MEFSPIRGQPVVLPCLCLVRAVISCDFRGLADKDWAMEEDMETKM